jgi:uncharacterized protein YndB with AHSA1/START domain
MNSLGRLSVTPVGDRELVMTRRFDAPRELVFDCYTKPALVRRWLLGPPGWTMPVCEIDLRVGGKYRYVWHGPDGSEMSVDGIIREIVAPERLVSTELYDEDWTGGETLSTIALAEEDDGTMLTHTVRYGSKEAREGALATGMTAGMEAGFVRLDEMLASTQAQALRDSQEGFN